MNDLSLIAEVIAYYENDDQPFSYHIAGMLDCKSELNSDWQSLYVSYVTGCFGPADCRFMYEMLNSAEV
jgi:hypothetical protein